MAVVKARFHFASEALDSKTTIVKVKSIQLLDQPEVVYLFPRDAQTNVQHSQLFTHPVTKGVLNTLKTRNKYRKVVITLLADGLRNIYLDDEGNVFFSGIYLEGVQADISSQSSPAPQNPNLERSIHSVTKNMVLEKFNGKNFNAGEWLKLFKLECNRLDIAEGKYSEVLRLFLEGPPLEWYTLFLNTHTLVHPWESWNNSFVDTFDVKNWSEIAYAYNYKYLNGSFLDFALRKRSLLLNVDPELTTNSQINLIIIALPNFIRSRIAKKELANIDYLMSALGQIEPQERKINTISYERKFPSKQTEVNRNSSCSYCERKGFGHRSHAESDCRTKMNDLKKNGNDKIKFTNNTEIQNSIALHDEAKN